MLWLGIRHVPDRCGRPGLPAGRFGRRRHDGRRPGSARGCRTCRCRSPSSSAPSTCGTVARVSPVLIAGLVLILAALLPPVHPARREPPTARHGRRHRPARPAHRAGQPGVVHRPTDPRDAAALRRAAPVAVLLLNLDDFKLVNDSLGHAVGDDMLRAVGDRVQDSVRTGDTVARLGGDEFAVLIEDEPGRRSSRRRTRRAGLRRARSWSASGRCSSGPSVGMAMAQSDDSADVTADDLFTRADLAMYSAKRDQFSGVRTFTDGMRLDATEVTAVPASRHKTGQRDGVARIELLGDLRRAIDDDRSRPWSINRSSTWHGSGSRGRGARPLAAPRTRARSTPADFLPLVRRARADGCGRPTW